MRIASIKTENVMRCKLAEVVFHGDKIQLIGANGEGKSSFAKSIWMAFGGKSAIPDEPVTEGEEKASINIELQNGDATFILSRVIHKDGKTSLELRSKDGARYPSPQKMIDEFNSIYGFWPQEFINAKPKDQREILRQIVKLDFSKFDELAEELREERYQIGVVGKQQAALLESLRKIELPPEPENTAALFAKLQTLREKQDRKSVV